MNTHLDNKITRRDFLKITAGVCIQIGLPSIFLYSCQAEPSLTSTATPSPTITTTPSPTKTTTPDQTDLGFEPAYLKLHKIGELKNRAEKLWTIMESCRLCPRQCGVNRLKGMSGFCHSPGSNLVVSAFHL